MYSTDGEVWTQTSTGASFAVQGFGVTYSNNLWVAVGDDLPNGTSFGNIMYSTDGEVWTQTSSGASFTAEGYGVAGKL